MGSLKNRIALVTGASRGVGKGVALGLGEAEATVYITGRTVEPGNGPMGLPGTIQQTAEDVNRLGGIVAVQTLGGQERALKGKSCRFIGGGGGASK